MANIDDSAITFQFSGDVQMPHSRKAESGGREFPYLYYPILAETGLVKHCFTTRLGGVSKGMFESLNLSFSRGDDRKAVEENFRRVALALGTEYGNFVFTDQTHTTNVRRVGREDAGKGLTRERGYSDVDGLVTNEPGLVLSTFYADCVPLYFLDPKHRAIGLSHYGWRGTAAQKTCSVPSAHPSARDAMKSARTWRRNLKKSFLPMPAKFCWKKEMGATSLICGAPMKSYCWRKA